MTPCSPPPFVDGRRVSASLPLTCGKKPLTYSPHDNGSGVNRYYVNERRGGCGEGREKKRRSEGDPLLKMVMESKRRNESAEEGRSELRSHCRLSGIIQVLACRGRRAGKRGAAGSQSAGHSLTRRSVCRRLPRRAKRRDYARDWQR